MYIKKNNLRVKVTKQKLTFYYKNTGYIVVLVVQLVVGLLLNWCAT